MPSIWRGSGEPIPPSIKASRSAISAGRSEARKYPPLEVPPRIHITGTELAVIPISVRLGRSREVPASDPLQPHVGELLAEAVHVEPEHPVGELLALFLFIDFARAGLFQH